MLCKNAHLHIFTGRSLDMPSKHQIYFMRVWLKIRILLEHVFTYFNTLSFLIVSYNFKILFGLLWHFWHSFLTWNDNFTCNFQKIKTKIKITNSVESKNKNLKPAHTLLFYIIPIIFPTFYDYFFGNHK